MSKDVVALARQDMQRRRVKTSIMMVKMAMMMAMKMKMAVTMM